jgi:deazaflavin-dependent oxidoreductase (nitroreductase family)
MNDYEPSPVDWVADHVARYEATDGAEGAEFNGAPCVIVTTTGRKSGLTRKTPLIRVHDGDNYLLVASMGGARKNPVWFLNLQANPEFTLRDRGEVHQLVARVADADEKASRWPAALAAWPDYADYQARTDRDIPLIVCEPR